MSDDVDDIPPRKAFIRFDNRVDVGEIVTVLTVIGGLVVYFFGLDTRITRLEERQIAQNATVAMQVTAIKDKIDDMGEGQIRIEAKLDRKVDRP